MGDGCIRDFEKKNPMNYTTHTECCNMKKGNHNEPEHEMQLNKLHYCKTELLTTPLNWIFVWFLHWRGAYVWNGNIECVQMRISAWKNRPSNRIWANSIVDMNLNMHFASSVLRVFVRLECKARYARPSFYVNSKFGKNLLNQKILSALRVFSTLSLSLFYLNQLVPCGQMTFDKKCVWHNLEEGKHSNTQHKDNNNIDSP